MTRPRFRWYGIPYGGGWADRVPRQDSMPDRYWGWDVECTACGWQSRTGGAIRASVRREVADHLWREHGE